MSNIKAEAVKMQAKLEFFNKQNPALQAELISSGFFKNEVPPTCASPPDATPPHGVALFQIQLILPSTG